MRNISEVIDQMISKVPQDNSKIILLLEKIKEDVSFTAPEAMFIRWRQVSLILQGEMSNPTENWQYEVLSIFSTEPFEEIKSFYERKKNEINKQS